MSDPSASSSEAASRPNLLEWAVAAVGALLLLAIVGFLVAELFGRAGAPPDLRVTLGAAAQRGSQVLVPVHVENVGGSTAEDATVEVCAGPEACAEVSFPFVPHGSERGGFVGLRAPLAGPLEARVKSYRLP